MHVTLGDHSVNRGNTAPFDFLGRDGIHAGTPLGT
jgi:hypothetical protein